MMHCIVFIQSVKNKKTSTHSELEMNVIQYKSSSQKDHAGGAYLFIPTGEAKVRLYGECLSHPGFLSSPNL